MGNTVAASCLHQLDTVRQQGKVNYCAIVKKPNGRVLQNSKTTHDIFEIQMNDHDRLHRGSVRKDVSRSLGANITICLTEPIYKYPI